MALIENQSIYPLKPNPVSTDFVTGTDSQDSNRTVSFSISALQAAVGATIYTLSNVVPDARTVTHNNTMSFTGPMAASEFLAQHTNGHVFRVNQNGIFGSSFGVGIITQNASAILQADSTTKGFLPPRMSTLQRNAIVFPATGLTIFNTSSGFIETYDGSTWTTNSNINIYNANGSITEDRVVSIESNNKLVLDSYNTDSSNYTNRSTLTMVSNSVLLESVVGDGLGGVVSITSFSITQAGSGIFTDGTNSKGIEYAADYSTNFTTRSLVDKGYVDSVLGSTTIYTGDGVINNVNRVVTLNDTDDSGNELLIQTTGTTLSTGIAIRYNQTRVYASNGANITQLNINQFNAVFTDAINSIGIQYAVDYSANFTARSLVDKDYVDSAVGSTFYTSDGTIDATSRVVTGNNNSNVTFFLNDLTSPNFNNRGLLRIGPATSSIGIEQGNGAGVVTNQMLINATTAAFTVTDSINNKGMVYAADYSANFTLRSLVDKEYVDGIAGATIYAADGILTQKRTVTGQGGDAISFILYNLTSADYTSAGLMSATSSSVKLAHQVGDGAGNLDTEVSISTLPTGVLIEDTTNNKGAEYAADYSANFIDRSLIDKGYGDLLVAQNMVMVRQASDFGVIDSSKLYCVDGIVDMSSTTIEVPSGGLNICGLDIEISKLISSDNNYDMFTSPIGGSGNVFINSLSIEVTGTSSNVFNLKSETGNEALEINKVNFNGCTSRGLVDNYRQIFESNIGLFGGSPDLELIGTMNGYRIDAFIARGITVPTALFKTGAGLIFQGRIAWGMNIDLPATGALFDFSSSEFTLEESFELNGCFITRSGILDSSDTTIYPNMNESDVVSFWINNAGITNTKKLIKATVTSEVTTVITAINTFEILLGTWTPSNSSHLDMPSNGEFRNLGQTDKFIVQGNLVVEGGASDVISVRLTKSTDGGSTWPVSVDSSTRQVNNLSGGRDIAFIPLLFIVDLNKDDKVRLEIENQTTTTNLTVESNSEILLDEA